MILCKRFGKKQNLNKPPIHTESHAKSIIKKVVDKSKIF